MVTSERHASRSALLRGLALAGLLIAATVLLKVLSPEHVGPERVARTLGVLFGAMAAFYANEVPKALSPLARLRDPAAEQSLRRYTGWTLSMGGVAYALTWMSAPIGIANPLAAACLAAALLLVAVQFARARFVALR